MNLHNRPLLISTFLLVCVANYSKAQDIIMKRDGQRIEATIKLYNQDTIIYKLYGDSTGALRGLSLNDVTSVTLKKSQDKSAPTITNQNTRNCDVITKVNGDKVYAVVQILQGQNVLYKLCNDTSKKVYSLNEEMIRDIVYKDGSRDEFNTSAPAPQINTPPSTTPRENVTSLPPARSETAYMKGMSDAKLYYSSYQPAGTVTFLSTFLGSPLIGLIPALTFSSIPPKPGNFNCPSQSLLSDPDYYTGYRDQAKRIKARKTWNNYLFGTIGYAILIIIVDSKK